jgi:hypothetical protein
VGGTHRETRREKPVKTVKIGLSTRPRAFLARRPYRACAYSSI